MERSVTDAEPVPADESSLGGLYPDSDELSLLQKQTLPARPSPALSHDLAAAREQEESIDTEWERSVTEPAPADESSLGSEPSVEELQGCCE